MRTLQVALRVADLDRSLAFYTALGYEIVGTVPETPLGRLTMLKLPDDEFVTLELVSAPDGHGLSHLAVQVGSMAAISARMRAAGVSPGEVGSPDGSADFLTMTIEDPDGNPVELVQWPAGHAAGMSAADWPD